MAAIRTENSASCADENDATEVPANCQRKWICNQERTQRPANFSTDSDFVIMTYNILNDMYCPPEVYPHCEQEYIAVEWRHMLLMKEINHHSDADIICMQEVSCQYYDEKLLPAMRNRGFSGCYMQRPKFISGTDGCATFYRHSKFEMTKMMGGHFRDLFKKKMESLPTAVPDELINSDRAYLFLLLRCTDTGKVLSVGNIHTTFDLFKVMDLTTLEIIFAINGLIQFAGGLNTPHILCGDFNQETHHPGYQLIRDGFLNSAMKDYLRNIRKQLIDVFHDSLTHESDSLQSAYKTVVGHEVPFSNYEDISQYMKVPKQDVPSANSQTLLDHGDSNPKIHKTDPETYGSEIYIAPLDYIWFSSDSLHCSGVLEMVQEELIVPFHACPNKAFPSDHLPIKAKFTFL